MNHCSDFNRSNDHYFSYCSRIMLFAGVSTVIMSFLGLKALRITIRISENSGTWLKKKPTAQYVRYLALYIFLSTKNRSLCWTRSIQPKDDYCCKGKKHAEQYQDNGRLRSTLERLLNRPQYLLNCRCNWSNLQQLDPALVSCAHVHPTIGFICTRAEV